MFPAGKIRYFYSMPEEDYPMYAGNQKIEIVHKHEIVKSY